MRLLLFILSCLLSFNVFSQKNDFGTELGDYVTILDHQNAKGIDFKFRKPVGYNEMNGSSSNTVKLYSSGNSSFGDREIIIQVFDYDTYFPEGKLISRSNFLDFLDERREENNTLEYFSLKQYPGWIFQEDLEGYTSLQVNIFLDNTFLVVSFTSLYVITESDINYIKKLVKSIDFFDVGIETSYQMAINSMDDENYSLAINEFTSHINQSDNVNPEAYFKRAVCRIRLKDYALAIPDLNIAISNKPSDGDLYYIRGICLMQSDNYSGAISDFKLSISLSEPHDIDPMIYTNLGLSYLWFGDENNACEWLETACLLKSDLACSFLSEVECD